MHYYNKTEKKIIEENIIINIKIPIYRYEIMIFIQNNKITPFAPNEWYS